MHNVAKSMMLLMAINSTMQPSVLRKYYYKLSLVDATRFLAAKNKHPITLSIKISRQLVADACIFWQGP